MTSGKRTRRDRQVKTPPPPTSSTGGRRASPKVLVTAVVVLVAAGLGIALAVALTQGGSSSADVPERGTLTNAIPGARDVDQQLRGIPQQGRVLGKASAPVTMVEYVDLQCPYCRQFHAYVLPTLIERYVRPGKLKIETRPIAFIGPDSERGRAAILAAGQQNRFFNLMGLFYFNQGAENAGWLSDDMITSASASIPGFDVPALLAARDTSQVKDESERLNSLATTDNVQGTPTVFVGKSGDALQQLPTADASDPAPVTAAIEKALR